MDEKALWAAFQKTGRVADYLRYRGYDVFDAATVDTVEEADNETDHRRPDHPGKQQYR